MPTPPHTALSIRGVSKRFGSVCALDGVDLDLDTGAVHGIVGENGAGKSTLMNVLSGVYPPSAGSLHFRGAAIHLQRPIDAQRLGIAMIHQELNLVDELSTADNIFLGRERMRRGWLRRRFVDRRATMKQAREWLRSLDCEINPATRVKRLSIAQKQMVEIAKALSCDARIVIMDEPTAVLTSRETTLLLALIGRLRRQGVTVVYISHLLPEVLAICDRITVMRDGKIVRTVTPTEVGRDRTGESKLASLMVGREMSNHFPPRPPTSKSEFAAALDVRSFSVPRIVHDATFTVKAGEILAFAGLIGSGRTELAEGVVGLRGRCPGRVLVNGKAVEIRRPRDAMTHGIAYVSEDRRGRGLTMGMGVVENTTLASLREFCRSRMGARTINRRAEQAAAMKHVQAMSIRIGQPRGLIDTLSGGNQQKVAIAKWLHTSPKVLILDEPTRGVDIGAKEEIYRLIRDLTQRGMACVLISSELNEVLGMADRIAVMRGGRIIATLDGATATEQQVMHQVAGVAGSHTLSLG